MTANSPQVELNDLPGNPGRYIAQRKMFAAFLAELDGIVTVNLRPVVNGIVSDRFALITSCSAGVLQAIIREYPFSSVQNGGVLVDFVIDRS